MATATTGTTATTATTETLDTAIQATAEAATTARDTAGAIAMDRRWRGTMCKSATATTPVRAARSMIATAVINGSTETKTSTKPSTPRATARDTIHSSADVTGTEEPLIFILWSLVS